MFRGSKEKGIFQTNVITEILDVFIVRIQKYTDDITTAINFGVCMIESAKRKGTADGATIGKEVDCAECIG